METIQLGTSGRHTTRLGYGCTGLMGALGRKPSLALLEAAYDAGIRHYDVAPMYGFGAAEACLGEFLLRHPGQVTVTTKYGIPPPRNQSLLGIARRVAKPVLKMLPGAKQKLAKAAGSIARAPQRANFTPAQAAASLDRSLAQLRLERIDVWLLHEVEAASLADDTLLEFLERSVTAGKIGTFGIGSGAEKIPALLANAPRYCRTLQFEWSILDPELPPALPFRIHHRALTDRFRQLHDRLIANPARLREWSHQTAADLSQRQVLAAIMLKASLVFNPHSVILFSSKDPAHIASNVRHAVDTALETPARRLHELLSADRSNS